MSEYEKRLMKMTRWCAWMVYPATAFFKATPGWIPGEVRRFPLKVVCRLLWLHVVADRMLRT